MAHFIYTDEINEINSYDSSCIEWVCYNRYSQSMVVYFLGNDRKGYLYYGVPRHVWDGFVDAPSRGTYYRNNIRGTYSSDIPQEYTFSYDDPTIYDDPTDTDAATDTGAVKDDEDVLHDYIVTITYKVSAKDAADACLAKNDSAIGFSVELA